MNVIDAPGICSCCFDLPCRCLTAQEIKRQERVVSVVANSRWYRTQDNLDGGIL